MRRRSSPVKVMGCSQAPAVGIDVLAQQGHFDAPGGQKIGNLGDDGLGLPAGLPAPDIRDHAVGAEIVAALHDGHQGRHRSLGPLPGRQFPDTAA